jgi:acetyl-CoA C-acetyltransferase
MSDVAILGLGQISVAKHANSSLRKLASSVCGQAMKDAGIGRVEAVFVGNMIATEATGQGHLGPLLAGELGCGPVECVSINAACASGAAAVRQAFLAVASGQYETVLAVGLEKMSCLDRNALTRLLATAADAELEVANNATFLALNALLMQRYMHEYGVPRKSFYAFANVAHENALMNPHARLRERVSLECYLRSRMVADPIGLYDCCPTGDGAAAVVLGRNLPRRGGILISGSSCASDSLSLQERRNPLWLHAAEESCRSALRQANRSLGEVDLLEPHDAFTVMAALSLEACGFAERGRGVEFASEEGVGLRGRLPICTGGGLKARGHPVGATGVYQVIEAALQLRGEAGPNQVPGAAVAMTQSFGGTAATVITHILERC